MNKLILLGVDVDLSPATQQALYVTSELFAHSSADLCLVLLHVIPIPYDTTPAWGKSLVAVRPFPPTTQERLRAERALQQARRVLRQQGIAPERILPLQRVGVPADEIARAARELDVALNEHPGSWLVFTARDVAQMFAPPDRTVGSQEVDAATRALEELARGGVLCCHRVKGEVRYSND